MNIHEWFFYRNQLTSYLISPEGAAQPKEKRDALWREVADVNRRIDSLMKVWNTDESTIETYSNIENEINF